MPRNRKTNPSDVCPRDLKSIRIKGICHDWSWICLIQNDGSLYDRTSISPLLQSTLGPLLCMGVFGYVGGHAYKSFLVHSADIICFRVVCIRMRVTTVFNNHKHGYSYRAVCWHTTVTPHPSVKTLKTLRISMVCGVVRIGYLNCLQTATLLILKHNCETVSVKKWACEDSGTR